MTNTDSLGGMREDPFILLDAISDASVPLGMMLEDAAYITSNFTTYARRFLLMALMEGLSKLEISKGVQQQTIMEYAAKVGTSLPVRATTQEGQLDVLYLLHQAGAISFGNLHLQIKESRLTPAALTRYHHYRATFVLENVNDYTEPGSIEWAVEMLKINPHNFHLLIDAQKVLLNRNIKTDFLYPYIADALAAYKSLLSERQLWDLGVAALVRAPGLWAADQIYQVLFKDLPHRAESFLIMALLTEQSHLREWATNELRWLRRDLLSEGR
jgi:hypothetical protein